MKFSAPWNRPSFKEPPFVLVALLGLLWSALGLFVNLTAALDFIFRVPRERGVWQQQLTAFAMSLVFIFLMAVSFLTSAALQLLSAFLLNTTQHLADDWHHFLARWFEHGNFRVAVSLYPAPDCLLGCDLAGGFVGRGRLGADQVGVPLVSLDCVELPVRLRCIFYGNCAFLGRVYRHGDHAVFRGDMRANE